MIRERTAGRKKGTPNKRTAELLDILSSKWPDYHPVVAMAALANDETVEIELRFQAHKEVAQYVAPKRKAIEVTGQDGGPVETVFRWQGA
jgi:hypothetical protein